MVIKRLLFGKKELPRDPKQIGEEKLKMDIEDLARRMITWKKQIKDVSGWKISDIAKEHNLKEKDIKNLLEKEVKKREDEQYLKKHEIKKK